MEDILKFDGPNRWLSNFTKVTISLDGNDYPSVENAYQAAKTITPGERTIFETCTAGQAKRAGRKVTMRPRWNDIKRYIMFELNDQKYNIEPFRTQLINTWPAALEEGNTWNDTFWGVCNGKGQNQLGKILMQIRFDLHSELRTQ
jgi:ribA/ribD-fused uncharacterized protein